MAERGLGAGRGGGEVVGVVQGATGMGLTAGSARCCLYVCVCICVVSELALGLNHNSVCGGSEGVAIAVVACR